MTAQADHRRARRPRPPGQFRPAVHQGHQPAPHRHAGRHPAPAPARAAAPRPNAVRQPEAIGWDDANREIAEQAAGHPRRARPRVDRHLHLGPAADRGLPRLQQAGARRHRHAPHRLQLAAVHELGRGRLQAVAGRRCAALQLRGHRAGRLHPRQWRQPGLGTPRAVPPPGSGTRRPSPSSQAHRHRPAPHRDRRAGRPAPADPPRHRRGAVPWPAACRHLRSGWTAVDFIARVHRRLCRRLEGAGERLDAGARGSRSAA